MHKRWGLVIIIIVWCVVAIGSVGYNSINTVFEIKNWYFLTDTQKREKIFGDLYTFLIFTKNHSDNAEKILIFSKDVRTQYFGMYTLYPIKITSTSSKQKLMTLAQTKQFLYIATANETLTSPYYQKIASYTETNSGFGVLYKKK